MVKIKWFTQIDSNNSFPNIAELILFAFLVALDKLLFNDKAS